MAYIQQILIAVDQLANAIIGGWADETISARAHRMSKKSKLWAICEKIIDTLFFFQPSHCKQAYESEMHNRQLPPEYR